MAGSAVGCMGIRAAGVLCQNTTGRPISVAFYALFGGVVITATINGFPAVSGNQTVYFVVPPAATYVITGGPMFAWNELR